MVTLLAPIALALLATGVAVRTHTPPNQLPAAIEHPTPSGTQLSRTFIRGDGFTVDARQLSTNKGRVLELHPLGQVLEADVLVYLGRRGAVDLKAARLLGSLAGPETVRFPLPDSTSRGVLFFYSPASGQLLARDSVSLAR
jgi:hypothetical protein